MTINKWLVLCTFSILPILGCSPNKPGTATATQPSAETQTKTVEHRVSRFGEYSGYSKVLYNGWVTTSRYVTMPDGTKLAVDISRPANNGVVTDTPYPVVWTASRYHRRWGKNPSIDSSPPMQNLVKHGYVVASVQVRGGGASFGRNSGLFNKAETRDSYDLIDWFSKQPWSDGKVGMYGSSYLGITQYMVASLHPPALKAIIPAVSYLDFYDKVYPGGIYRQAMVKTWSDQVRDLDTNRKNVIPVDADKDGKLADQAVAGHKDNFNPIPELRAARFRDSQTKDFSWYRDTPSAVLDKINSSGIAIYNWGGWYDAYVMDTLMFTKNYPGPEKTVIGVWAHEPVTKKGREERNRLYAVEALRWYDYWLKGIKNGVMDGPEMNYAIIDVPRKKWSWHATNDISKITKPVDYFFGPSSFLSKRVPKDNGLSVNAPPQALIFPYAVNLETTTGKATRWSTTVGGPNMDYPEMTPNDVRSLTFTTAPLKQDVTVLGVPIVTLYASSSKKDADFYVLLEEVDAKGNSHYVSEGLLRGSDQAVHKAPWDTLGAPWHRGLKADRRPMRPGKVYELKFNLEPTGYLFNKGNRLRIAVMGADKDNTEAPPDPDAILNIVAGGKQASTITLPVVKPH